MENTLCVVRLEVSKLWVTSFLTSRPRTCVTTCLSRAAKLLGSVSGELSTLQHASARALSSSDGFQSKSPFSPWAWDSIRCSIAPPRHPIGKCVTWRSQRCAMTLRLARKKCSKLLRPQMHGKRRSLASSVLKSVTLPVRSRRCPRCTDHAGDVGSLYFSSISRSLSASATSASSSPATPADDPES